MVSHTRHLDCVRTLPKSRPVSDSQRPLQPDRTLSITAFTAEDTSLALGRTNFQTRYNGSSTTEPNSGEQIRCRQRLVWHLSSQQRLPLAVA